MGESNAAVIVDSITKEWLGTVGGILAVLGVIAAPITSGDTAFRSARLIVADFLHKEQKSMVSRLVCPGKITPDHIETVLIFQAIEQYADRHNKQRYTNHQTAYHAFLFLMQEVGYKLAREGDSIDLGYANLNSRRGRVGHQIAHTLTTGIQQGTLHFVDLSPPPLVTEECRSLNTRQCGIHKYKGECSGVLREEGARAVLTPDRKSVV